MAHFVDSPHSKFCTSFLLQDFSQLRRFRIADPSAVPRACSLLRIFRLLLLWVPCQGLTLATMFLKPTRSPVCRKTVTALQPAANASPSMKSNLFLPLCLFPLIFPSSTNFSSPPFLSTCPTNLSCLFLMVITKLLSMPTNSSICSFEILFTHDIRIILR